MSTINLSDLPEFKMREIEKFVMSLREAASLVSLSPRTLSRMNEQGKLRIYKLGGKHFVKIDEFKEDIHNNLEPV